MNHKKLLPCRVGITMPNSLFPCSPTRKTNSNYPRANPRYQNADLKKKFGVGPIVLIYMCDVNVYVYT